MKKYILSIASFILLFTQLHSEDFWEKMELPVNDTVRAMVVDLRDNIYIGSYNNGVLFSSDYGKTWKKLDSGYDLKSGRITVLACDSSNNIYAGTNRGGIYGISYDNNVWTKMNNGIDLDSDSLFSIDFVCDNGNNLYSSMSNLKPWKTRQYGLFKSVDQGKNWVRMNSDGELMNNMIFSMAVDQSNNVFIGTGGNATLGGMYYSNNYGDLWFKLINNPVFIGQIHVDQKSYIYFRDYSKLYKTSDTGKTMQIIFQCNTYFTRTFQTKGNELIASVGDSGLFKSSDDGISWLLIDTLKINNSLYNITESHNGYLFGASDKGFFRSKTKFHSNSLLCNISPFSNDTAKFFQGDIITYNFEITDSVTNKPLENTKLYLSDNLVKSNKMLLTDVYGKATYTMIVPQGTPISDYELKLYYFKSGYDKKDTIIKTFHIDKKINSVDFSISDKFLNVNPNPVINTSTITYSLPQQTEFSLFLTDITGNKFLLLSDNRSAGDYKYNMDTKNLISGTYIISLEFGEEKYIKKVDVVK